MEAARDLIVKATIGHPFERQARHVLPVATPPTIITAKQKGKQRARWKLRRTTKATMNLIDNRRQRADRAIDHRTARRIDKLGLLAGMAIGSRLQRRRDPFGLALDVAAALGKGLCNRLEDLRKRGHARSRLRRKVGTTVEGTPVGCQPDRHRPATMPRQANDGLHEDRIDIGPLLTIDLDVDVEAVHHRCRCRVLERLVRHHMAPVTGGIANAQQDRHIALACLGEGLVAPRLPVDRIVHVLPQIRRRLGGKAVGHTVIFAVRRDLGGGQRSQARTRARFGQAMIVGDDRHRLRYRERRGEMDRVERPQIGAERRLRSDRDDPARDVDPPNRGEQFCGQRRVALSTASERTTNLDVEECRRDQSIRMIGEKCPNSSTIFGRTDGLHKGRAIDVDHHPSNRLGSSKSRR